MIACERSDDDDDDDNAESSGRGSGNGCVEQARCGRQADRSVLLHGLCAVTIALAAARILPASAFTAFTALAVCLVGVRVLSPVLRTLSCGLFRSSGPCGRRSAEASAIDPRNGGRRSVPQRRPQVPPPTTTSGGDALPLVKRCLRLLMRVMRVVQRWAIVIRPKRSRRSTRRCHDTSSRSVTTCSTTAETVETVTGSRAGNDYVHCSRRQYQLVRTSRGQR